MCGRVLVCVTMAAVAVKCGQIAAQRLFPMAQLAARMQAGKFALPSCRQVTHPLVTQQRQLPIAAWSRTYIALQDATHPVPHRLRIADSGIVLAG